MNTISIWKFGFLLAGAFAIFGCVYVPHKSTYLHLEKANNLVVTEVERLDFEKSISLHNVDRRYLLTRAKYTISFEISTKSISPNLEIRLLEPNGKIYPVYSRAGISVTSCLKLIPHGEKSQFKRVFNLDLMPLSQKSQFKLVLNNGCISFDKSKVLSFNVLDESGVEIGQEDLAYTIKKSGIYFLVDAM